MGSVKVIREVVGDLFIGKKIVDENVALVGKKRSTLENVGEVACGKVGSFDGLVVFAEEFYDFLPGFYAVVTGENFKHGEAPRAVRWKDDGWLI